MIIGIDGTRGINEKAGIGRYTKNLVAHMAQYPNVDVCFLFTFMRGKKSKLKEISNVVGERQFTVKLVPGELKNSLWGGPVSWPDFFMPQVDLWHAPSIWEAPLATKRALVLTIHDMTPFLFPELRGEKVSSNQKRRTVKAAHRADHIIAVSKATKDDIVKYLPETKDKITVVHLGLDPIFRTLNYIKKDKIILVVGTVEPRKNLRLLFDAFSALPKELQNEYKIWVVGAKGWNDKPIFARTKKMGDKVKFWGYVSDAKLVEIMNHAEIFAFPSLYEGFGLPLIEAMACGLPVITNDVSSMPEVAGGAAMIMPPNVAAWTAGLKRLMTDKASRSVLEVKGLGRAKEFSWKKTVKETAAVYNSVMPLVD